MNHPLYGKKKKKKLPSPNPLFEQWLTEWRDDAAEKSMKSQYTYGKALKALKKFPLQLERGKDCKILENFGDKICKMLDDRLDKHIAEFGKASLIPIAASDSSEDISVNSSPPRKSKSVKTNSPKAAAPSVHELSEDSDNDTPRQPKKRPKSGSGSGGEKEYIPQYRSGPYALLIALYQDQKNANSLGFMTKSSLITKAQPLADKSFTIPDPGCRYTAWSSMGSLIKRALVLKEGNPARFSLTDAGSQLAHRLEAVQPTDSIHSGFAISLPGKSPPLTIATAKQHLPGNSLPLTMATAYPCLPGNSPPLIKAPTQPSFTNLPNRIHNVNGQSSQQGDETKKSLNYIYVTKEGTETLDKDKSAISIGDDMAVGFLVKCLYTDLIQVGIQYKLNKDLPVAGDYVYAYLSNDDTADVAPATLPCPGYLSCRTDQVSMLSKGDNFVLPSDPAVTQLLPLEETSFPLSSVKSADRCEEKSAEAIVIDSEESSTDSVPSFNNFKTKCSPKQSACDSSFASAPASGNNSENSSLNLLERLANKGVTISDNSHSNDVNNQREAFPKVTNGMKEDFEMSTSSARLPASRVDLVDSQESSQHSVQSLTSEDTTTSQVSSFDADFVLYPGTFEIILCVDNAEFYGGTKCGSKNLLPDLVKNGVNCDLRKLHVGDMLWVAREKSLPRHGEIGRGAGRELVLNYVIERKRMDDLVSSCIDGRFKEQKFRLKQCGLQHPMYLVEDYGSAQHFSLPEATIKQAIINTQVIDGFQVKRTRDTKESVAFLTVFTRYIQSCYRNKTLYGCSLDTIKELKVMCSIDDLQQRLPVFEEFNQSSVKTKNLTVHEMFGKQLIQLHGMSAEKARAVLGLYPTLQHLLAAYGKCTTEKEKENMLASIKCGKTLRSLGQAQSRQIYQLYNTLTALV